MKIDFMKTVYDTQEYMPFRFSADYKKICDQFDNIPVINNNYSIAIKDDYYRKFQNESIQSLHESPLLTRHQLCVIRWKSQIETTTAVISNFKNVILKIFLSWEEKYISMITDHFKERASEGRMLNNHNSIKIQTGKIVSKLLYANQIVKHSTLLTDNNLIPDFHILASEKIKEIAIDLHKTSGGRAFVQENVVEMLCLFEIFRKIYFMRYCNEK